METYKYKVGDRIRLRKDVDINSLGERSRADLQNRTVYVIDSMIRTDIYPDNDRVRRWKSTWVELVPKPMILIRRK